MKELDDLEDDIFPEIHEVFFQFDEEEPIKFAYSVGREYSIRLIMTETDTPTVSFTDGRGKEFKIFMK